MDTVTGTTVTVRGITLTRVRQQTNSCDGCAAQWRGGPPREVTCFDLPNCSRAIFVKQLPGMQRANDRAVAPARGTDPVTSKRKAKVNKYEQAVLTCLLTTGNRTGKEIALHMNQPLNCITPRFAPLRRKGLIKDSDTKRDKQIVWALT